MQKIIFIFSFLLLANFSFAQVNLVPNPSFETYYSCPFSTGQVDSCIGWSKVLNTPDYFNTCSPYPVSIPSSVVGYQNVAYGNGYVGLLTYSWFLSNYREIMGAQLLLPTVSGVSYHISMRVSRGNWTNQAYNCAASNKLGIRFTTSPYSTSNLPSIDNYANVHVDSIVKDTLNWVLLEWDYVADSSYEYVYIGNFFTDAFTDTAVINAPIGQFGQAYYYIDSIKIACKYANCTIGISELPKSEDYFRYYPSESKIKIFNAHNSSFFYLLNSAGQIIINSSINVNQDKEFYLNELSAGIYLIVLQLPNQTITKKIIISNP